MLGPQQLRLLPRNVPLALLVRVLVGKDVVRRMWKFEAPLHAEGCARTLLSLLISYIATTPGPWNRVYVTIKPHDNHVPGGLVVLLRYTLGKPKRRNQIFPSNPTTSQRLVGRPSIQFESRN